ncbi:glycosyltransferase [Phormidium sp. CCY1219]|uniref:glycosyltransferase n=1 Tax=Phormidium sp. CCY1219 TaxID=2886104 RepID=UPI002D1E988F|nr:glycosyltransferase family 2 protein [Phormidium sp. CCY1219]MEB3829709.1 glycosyltransferase family 2 protein [Phormidium sp. CCY1219]
MPANSWPENNSFPEFEPLSSILSAWSDSESEAAEDVYRGYKGRRRKAAVLLVFVWSGTVALHLLSFGSWIVLGFTGVMGIHALRVLLTRPADAPPPLSEETREHWPRVSLLVAAKNEEAVIAKLIDILCNLDYPKTLYEVWAIDDNSSDRTPQVLERLQKKYDNLKVFRRSADATGGKSGALNQVLPLTCGEILAVFDADAQVSPDVLRRVLPAFHRPQVGAVQMRKAIANPSVNFLTRGQMAEMALDSYFQQQRTALGGIGELRGNGEFIRRHALERCGGFNEETITDDLDLTLRLHLDRWDIEFLMVPVREEGVTQPLALWHQRNRWGEGGYQRYLDYWRLILSNRMGIGKTWDMFNFWTIQYFLPAATVPDLLMAIARNRLPVFAPITSLAIALSLVAMFVGLRRIETSSSRQSRSQPTSSRFIHLLQTLRGTVYMFHWLGIVASIAIRMSVRPKRLKWVKTLHQGS